MNSEEGIYFYGSVILRIAPQIGGNILNFITSTSGSILLNLLFFISIVVVLNIDRLIPIENTNLPVHDVDRFMEALGNPDPNRRPAPSYSDAVAAGAAAAVADADPPPRYEDIPVYPNLIGLSPEERQRQSQRQRETIVRMKEIMEEALRAAGLPPQYGGGGLNLASHMKSFGNDKLDKTEINTQVDNFLKKFKPEDNKKLLCVTCASFIKFAKVKNLLQQIKPNVGGGRKKKKTLRKKKKNKKKKSRRLKRLQRKSVKVNKS